MSASETKMAVNRRLFVSVLVLGMAVAGYLLWLLNTYRELAVLLQHFRQLQQQYSQQALPAGQPDATEQNVRLHTLLHEVTGKEQLSGVTELLTVEIRQAGLQLQQIQWLPERELPLYRQQPLLIRLHGDYHQFGMLLHALLRQPFLLGWHDLTISRQTDGQQLMELTISIYHSVAIPLDALPVSAEPIMPENYLAGLRNPFTALATTASDTMQECHQTQANLRLAGAERYLPEQLIFRGILKDSRQTLALIEDPQQRLHLVAQATATDLFRGEVVSVQHDVLEIRDSEPDADGCIKPRLIRLTIAGA